MPIVDDAAVLGHLQQLAVRRVPSFRVRYKDESFTQRLLGLFLWPFNPGYSKSFATTVGTAVWLPSRAWVAEHPDCWLLLAHEYVHVYDNWRRGGRGRMRRAAGALPEILFAVVVLLLLLLPWPGSSSLVMSTLDLALRTILGAAVFGLLVVSQHAASDARLSGEVRGAAATMAGLHWSGQPIPPGWIARQAALLAGSTYFWAARSESVANTRLGAALVAVTSGALVEQPESAPYLDLAEALSLSGALVRTVRGFRGVS